MNICGLLGDFADGELNDEGAAAFRAHLATCPKCERELLRTLWIIDAISDMPHPSQEWIWRWSWLWMRWYPKVATPE